MPRETAFPEPMPEPPAPRRRRYRRWPWVVGGTLALVMVSGAVALARLDLNAWKPRIQQAAKDSTGRDLVLAGPIGLKLSLVPTVTVDDVAFANMPGGSRPQMATVRRAEVELALLPLLSKRVEVRRLRLVAPDILLETDALGRANWVLGPPPGAAPAQPAPAPAEAPAAPLAIGFGRIVVEQGTLAWRNGATGETRRLEVPQLEATTDGPDGGIRAQGSLTLDGTPVALVTETGPLAGLLGGGTERPWPLRATVEAAGARFGVEGSIARPTERRDWQATLTAAVPDTRTLAPLLPDVPIPPLQAVQARVSLADAGPGRQALTALDLTIGASPLDPLVPGLALGRFHAALPGPDATLTLEGEGRFKGLPVRLSGTTRSPLPPQGMAAPLPLDLTLALGGGTVTVKGGIVDPERMTGVDLALAAALPDLAALAPLAGRPLPPVRDLRAQARLSERGGYRLSGGAFLKGIQVTSSAGDIAGDLTLVQGMRSGAVGALASKRLDLDALLPPPAPQGAPAGPAAPAAKDGRVIPDTPLPLEILRLTDSDLRLSVAELRSGGTLLRDLAAHAVIEDGRGRLDPLDVTLPGGRVAIRAAADVTATPPAVQVAVRSDGLDLAPLMAALQAPAGTAGRAEIDLDLRGHGRDLRAVAATATGHFGLALTNGQAESGSGSLLGRAVGELRQVLPQLGGLAEGRIGLACAATRWRVEGGIARSEVLLLDGTLGKVGGGGAASLRDETLAMRLNLDLRLPVPGVNRLRIRAPVPLTGTFANPRPDYGEAAARGALSTAEGLARIPGGIAGDVLGALGGPNLGPNDGGLPECGPALAIARGGRAGPVPASGAPAERPAAPLREQLPGAAQDLLRGLLRQR